MSVRAGIVGLGDWGQTLVNSVQGKSEKIAFTAGVTRTAEKARTFANEKHFALYDNYAALIDNPELDAVVLATPHSQHAEQIIQAASAGKHVFCEKPITLDVGSAEQALKACRAAGVILAVGFNRRFLPPYRDLKALIDAGTLGKILHVEGQWSKPARKRPTLNSWRNDPSEAPGGAPTSINVHALDALIGLVGDANHVYAHSCAQVSDRLAIDDTVVALFRMKSGASVMLTTLTTLAAKTQTLRLHVFGSAGSAEMRGANQLVITPASGASETHDYPPFDMERAELEAFADAIAGKADYPVSNADVLAGVVAFDAMIRSVRTGQSISF